MNLAAVAVRKQKTKANKQKIFLTCNFWVIWLLEIPFFSSGLGKILPKMQPNCKHTTWHSGWWTKSARQTLSVQCKLVPLPALWNRTIALFWLMDQMGHSDKKTTERKVTGNLAWWIKAVQMLQCSDEANLYTISIVVTQLSQVFRPSKKNKEFLISALLLFQGNGQWRPWPSWNSKPGLKSFFAVSHKSQQCQRTAKP